MCRLAGLQLWWESWAKVLAHLLDVGEQLARCCCSSLLPVVHLLLLLLLLLVFFVLSFSFLSIFSPLYSHSRLLVSLMVTSRPHPRESRPLQGFREPTDQQPSFLPFLHSLSLWWAHYLNSHAFPPAGQRVSHRLSLSLSLLGDNRQGFLASISKSFVKKKRK